MKSHVTLQVATPAALGTVTAEEAELLAKLDSTRLPRHVAVIMDGNGRWAQRKLLPRVAGHKVGAQTTRTIIETCARLNVEALTLYAFSVENWRRPKTETDFLMQLLREYLRTEMPLIQRNNIRMRFLGRSSELPIGVQQDMKAAEEKTAANGGMVLCLALNYGGRAEIVDAANAILAERTAQGSAAPLTEEEVSRRLYTAGLPDPDLLIRTSGEMRVSNFSAVADRIRRDFCDRDALAGLQSSATARIVSGFSEARAAVWRDWRKRFGLARAASGRRVVGTFQFCSLFHLRRLS